MKLSLGYAALNNIQAISTFLVCVFFYVEAYHFDLTCLLRVILIYLTYIFVSVILGHSNIG